VNDGLQENSQSRNNIMEKSGRSMNDSQNLKLIKRLKKEREEVEAKKQRYYEKIYRQIEEEKERII
jgi:hypothetical protein